MACVSNSARSRRGDEGRPYPRTGSPRLARTGGCPQHRVAGICARRGAMVSPSWATNPTGSPVTDMTSTRSTPSFAYPSMLRRKPSGSPIGSPPPRVVLRSWPGHVPRPRRRSTGRSATAAAAGSSICGCWTASRARTPSDTSPRGGFPRSQEIGETAREERHLL